MGYFYVILCQIIVGSSYPIAKVAIDTIPEWILACITLGIASIVLMPLACKIEKVNWVQFGWNNWMRVGIQSLCACVLYTVFLFFALSHASAVVSGIFNGLSPACVLLLSPFITNEKNTLSKTISILLAVIAVFIVSNFSISDGTETDWIGIVFLLLSVLSVSLFTVFSKKFAVNLLPITSAAGVCVTGFIITIPFCIYQTLAGDFSYSVILQNENIFSVLYYALFVWAVAYVLWYYGIPKVAASFGGIAQAIVPISSMLASIVFFGEQIDLSDVFGVMLMVSSVVLSVFSERKISLELLINEGK